MRPGKRLIWSLFKKAMPLFEDEKILTLLVARSPTDTARISWRNWNFTRCMTTLPAAARTRWSLLYPQDFWPYG